MPGLRRISRWMLALGIPAYLALAAPAQAAGNTYLVAVGGSDTGDCISAPCETVEYALQQHRAAADPDDVIEIGPGSFAQNIEASDPDDQGLTIRGTLLGSTRETTITGDSDGGSTCMVPCVVQLGFDPDIEVNLEHINVDNTTADDFVTPISIEGGSDLTDVHASGAPGAGISEVVAMCNNPGTVIQDSVIDATDTFGVGIDSTSGAVIRDSTVHSDEGSAILQFPEFGKRPYRIVRSHLSSNADAFQPVLLLSGDLKLDSSLVNGGASGAVYSGFTATSWRIENSTIDAGDPGVDNSPDDIDSLALASPDGSPAIDVAVDSSLLVDDIFIFTGSGFDGPGTVTCDYTNLPSATIPSPWTDNCPLGGGSTNTSEAAADLFVGGPSASYDWQLKDGSPGIDTGRPGPIEPGFSTRDLAGNRRRQPGLDVNCADPIRDKGAYEHQAVLCRPVNNTLPTIANGTAPDVGVQIRGFRGTWFDRPTSFAMRWLRCQPAHPDDCTAATGSRDWHSYTPRQADAGFVLRMEVVATNAAGDSDPALSAPTGVVGGTGGT
jgi:hypothetical protein